MWLDRSEETLDWTKYRLKIIKKMILNIYAMNKERWPMAFDMF
jgi:hypothetical protein